MTRWRTTLLGLLLSGGLVYGALYLFGVEFAAGEVYPEYSSLRTDPDGTRLLYESLAALPGVTVERNYRALEFLPDGGVTVLLLAVPAGSFGADSEPYLRNMEASARRGNRMVAALSFKGGEGSLKFEELTKRWGVKIAAAPKAGPHPLYFADAPAWTELDRAGARSLAIERAFGKGSIVLFTESDAFANDATVATKRLPLVTQAIGSNTHVIFDEQHLGIADSGSVVALARRFHLTGVAFGLALCALLVLWRNGVDFPPPSRAARAGRLAGRTSQSGLITLLRRHVPPPELAAACWQGWLDGNRGKVSPERLARANAIAGAAADRPVEALREIAAVLHAKGES